MGVTSKTGVVTIKEKDYVYYGDEKCYVYEVTSEDNIGLERCSDGVSWDMCEMRHCIPCSKYSPNERRGVT